MIITQAQARGYASAAGFSGSALDTIIAIAQAESSLNTSAQHTNGDGSVDRGILQINSRWHPEVSDACAYDPGCAFRSGYKISSNGTSFSPWATYTSGAYLRYMSGGGTTTSQGTLPPYTGTAWYNFPDYHNFGIDGEHGVDLGVPPDTPITAILSGTVTEADYQPWGGSITWQVDDPSLSHGKPYEYVIHLDAINPDIQVGTHIQAGTFLGYSGAETPSQLGLMKQLPPGYSHHTTDPQYSTGPHIEVGLYGGPKIGYGSAWQPNADPSYDPDFLISYSQQINLPYGTDLSQGGGQGGVTPLDYTGNDNTPIQQKQPIAETVHNVLVEVPGFAGIALALDVAEQFPGLIWYQAGQTYHIVPSWGGIGDIINNAASDILNIGSADYIGAAMRSILDTIISNTTALLFRMTIVGIGLLLVAALIWKFVNDSGISEDVAQVAKVAAMAAA